MTSVEAETASSEEVSVHALFHALHSVAPHPPPPFQSRTHAHLPCIHTYTDIHGRSESLSVAARKSQSTFLFITAPPVFLHVLGAFATSPSPSATVHHFAEFAVATKRVKKRVK